MFPDYVQAMPCPQKTVIKRAVHVLLKFNGNDLYLGCRHIERLTKLLSYQDGRRISSDVLDSFFNGLQRSVNSTDAGWLGP